MVWHLRLGGVSHRPYETKTHIAECGTEPHPDSSPTNRTIASFGLGEQAENEGPTLNSKEIAKKLLKLLQFPREYKDNIAYWSRRSRASPGAKGAAHIIKQQAINQSSCYREAYASKRRLMTTFTSEIWDSCKRVWRRCIRMDGYCTNYECNARSWSLTSCIHQSLYLDVYMHLWYT